MKKRFLSILSLFVLSPTLLFAAPKIATLDVSKASDAHELNLAGIAAYKEAKASLENDPRKAAVIEMAKKVQALQRSLQELNPESEEHKKMLKDGQAAKASYDDILNEWTQYRTEKLRAMTEKVVAETNKRLNEIVVVSRAIADAEGYDWLLETAGNTSSKMPVVLYLRKSTDITEQVITKVNLDYPAEKPAEGAE